MKTLEETINDAGKTLFSDMEAILNKYKAATTVNIRHLDEYQRNFLRNINKIANKKGLVVTIIDKEFNFIDMSSGQFVKTYTCQDEMMKELESDMFETCHAGCVHNSEVQS